MKKSKNRLVTDLKKLAIPVAVSEFKPKEAEVISAALFTELKNHGGLGLSANQLGINKRICVINVKEPFYLVNPRIVEASEEKYSYMEACLSIPRSLRKPIKTLRRLSVTVEADNFEGQLDFGPDDDSNWANNIESFWSDLGFLECVVIQHEIDHLDGITIKNRQYAQPVTSSKFERNKKYMFKSPDGEMEFIKYKKGESLLSTGWEAMV